MFWTFFRFETRFWMRGYMLYFFVLIVALLVLAAMRTDEIQVGTALENSLRNSAFNVQNYYAVLGVLCSIMVTAFVNSAATRDYSYQTDQLLFTKPIKKGGYIFGRFFGAMLIAVLPMLGVTLGALLAAAMPAENPDRWGPTIWSAHVWGIVCFAIPNTLLQSAVVFAIATKTRSTMASFIGIILLLVGYGISQQMMSNLDNEKIAVLLDPFGLRAFEMETKYWTPAERNLNVVTLTGMLLWNRMLWIGLSLLILGTVYARFSFTRAARAGKTPPAEPTLHLTTTALPTPRLSFSVVSRFQQLISQTRIDFFGIIKSNVFIIVMVAGFLNMFSSLLLSTSEGFGLSSLPVTFHVITIVRGTMYIFLLGVMVFYSGNLVWKEREARLDEVYDALPHPAWLSYVSKFLALCLVVAVLQAVGIACGVFSQAINGYYRFQLSYYFIEMFVLDYLALTMLVILAFFSQIVSANKYVGYFNFIVLVILNAFIWSWLDIPSLMFHYGDLPSYTFSDMFGFAPYAPNLVAFGVYWSLFGLLLMYVSTLLWQRGRERVWRYRLDEAARRWSGGVRITSAIVAVVWFGVAGWVYYNTQVENELTPGSRQMELQVEYEQKFREHERLPQPVITTVKYDIDIYPEKRAMTMHGVQTIANHTSDPIEAIYLNVDPDFEKEISIDRCKLVKEYEELGYLAYACEPAMQPGEIRQMEYTVKWALKGFENQVSHTDIVQNGTFFNHGIAPQIGYLAMRELTDRNDRKENGLGEPRLMPALEPENLAARQFTYLTDDSNWVDVETVISTSADQIAIAPGSLVRSWEDSGRKFFHYRLDHKSNNFYAFISARYKVATRKWRDVDLEVYYHPEHEWNIERMLDAMEDTLEYCDTNFGPYRHKQARIIEFPRTATFAQAFPGTMPYSEGIGFVADISDPDDIDKVRYVVAHELAHQWWAHQVVGANMKGATVLSETLAQYSALMIMEHEYGRDMMRKFLRYEMDQYLRGRGREMLKERPLLSVEASQGYIHYNKGSVVMYQLKEFIGEEGINRALRSLVDKFAYQDPPYPTSIDLVEALRAETPSEYQAMIDDLFERITLYGNRVSSANIQQTSDGKFEVEIEIDCHKFEADEGGMEREVAMQGEWIEIGAFAASEPGKRYGATLYRERVQVNQGKSTHRFTLDEKPNEVGVDPFLLLIDRVPDDNLKKL